MCFASLALGTLLQALALIGMNMEIDPEFESERLQFRPIRVCDWKSMQEALNCVSFPKQLPLARLMTEHQIIDWHESRVNDWATGSCYVWSLIHKGDSVIIGQLSLLRLESGFALAYWITPRYWGAGLATEACSAVITELEATSFHGMLWAGTQEWNSASSRVLEKLGFQFSAQSEHELSNGNVEQINEYILDII